jgi:hypothetical protein
MGTSFDDCIASIICHERSDYYADGLRFARVLRCPKCKTRDHLRIAGLDLECLPCKTQLSFQKLIEAFQLHHDSPWLPEQWYARPSYEELLASVKNLNRMLETISFPGPKSIPIRDLSDVVRESRALIARAGG